MTQYFIVYLGGDQPSSREGWIPIKNGYFRAEELNYELEIQLNLTQDD